MDVDEVRAKFFSAIFDKYKDTIIKLMEEIDWAATHGKQGYLWHTPTENDDCRDVVAFLKGKGFDVIVDKNNYSVSILW